MVAELAGICVINHLGPPQFLRRPFVFRPAPVLISVFLLGAVQVGLAYIFFTFGTKYTDPVTASIINALEPILNPILVAVFYGEMLGRISIVGAVIVLCGILYYNLRKIG